MSLSPEVADGLRQVLGRWQGGEPATEGLPAWVEALARVEGPLRPRALDALRRRLDGLPLERVDSSWIAVAVPADPLLRLWALDSLPTALRRSVLAELAEEAPTSRAPKSWAADAAPAWFGGWWWRRLARHLDYPRDLPRAVDAARPWTYLDRLTVDELERLLARFGLRAMARGLGGLERADALALVFSLPPALRALLRQRATQEGRDAEGAAADIAGWRDVLVREADASRPGDEVARRLALEDLAAQATATGGGAAARRLALRLPRRLGAVLARRLGEPNATLVVADPGEWTRSLTMEIGRLRAQGLIAFRGEAAP